MKSIGEALDGLREPEPEDEFGGLPPIQPDPPEDRCRRCGERAYTPHTCCTCRDGGFVRQHLRVGQPGFGRVIPCPDCGGESGRADAEEWKRRSRVPVRFVDCRLESWEQRRYTGTGAPRERVALWCSEWPPKKPFLVLTGERGNGKTHLAWAAAWAMFDSFQAMSVGWNCTDLMQRFRATMDEDRATETEADIMRQLDNTPLLLLDDYGAQQDTEWARSKLYTIINLRYEGRKPTIVTTNIPLTADRTISRLLDSQTTIAVQFDGKDVRLG